jgi:hypothetical protein
MKDFLSKVMWALKMGGKLKGVSAQMKINDHPEFTKFLKNN